MRREKGLSTNIHLTQNFNALLKFFPDADMARIEQIEHFHHGLREILESEFKSESKELEAERQRITRALDRLNTRLEELSVAPTATQTDIRAFNELDRQIRALHAANKAFDDEKQLQQIKNDAAETLKENSAAVLQHVENDLNQTMAHIDGKITNGERTPPRITIPTIDKISRYNPETQRTLENTMFIHLESGRELFGRSWSKRKKKEGRAQ